MSPACPRPIFLPSNVSPAKIEKMKGWGAGRDRRRGLGRIERGGARVRREAGRALFPSLRRPAGRRRPGHARPRDPRGPARSRHRPRRHRRRRPDRRRRHRAEGAPAGHAHRRRRADRLADAEGEPRRRPMVALPEVTTSVPTMACRRTDERIFEIVRDTVDDIVLVSDEEMEEAARWLWFETGVAADLSGAAALAALRQRRVLSPARPSARSSAARAPTGWDKSPDRKSLRRNSRKGRPALARKQSARAGRDRAAPRSTPS